jgi:predicted CXXCH cytochrome family protein
MLKKIRFILLFLYLFVLSSFSHAQEFSGSEECAACHQEAYDNWQQSHHRHAMEVASSESVLGDFANASFDYLGRSSRFYQRDEEFFVETDNSAGELEEFKISYTFGFYPLQQYLVEFPDGRMQALSISWDSRPAEEGGQRWYHLYPDEEITSDDPLHWTGAFQNWNSRCASCHATDLNKNYSIETNSYNTQWSEINVGCEACHGAGSQHIDWAVGNTELANMGLLTNINKVWEPIAGQLQVPEDVDFTLSEQVQTCGGCHARRAELQQRDIASDFLNNYSLSPLLEGLYHADGQIQDEVYVLGSFLQSKMHANLVSCSNCHEPHTNELRIDGNGLCLQCHEAQTFQSQDHFFHEVGSAGAQCINCHMPETIYMGVDPRRDHSFRIPDPIASLELGVPNACSSCHSDQADQGVQWLVDFLISRNSNSDMQYEHAAIIASARQGDASVAPEILALASDDTNSAMLRSIALIESARFPSLRNLSVALAALGSSDALVRASAVSALSFQDVFSSFQYLQTLLEDPIKSVRMSVARHLSSIPLSQVPTRFQATFSNLLTEYEESLLFNADMPEYMSDLGAFYVARGDLNSAQEALLHARELSPAYLPALINLSDVYRAQDRDDLGELVLNDALTLYPESGDVSYALGILYVRTGRIQQSISLFDSARILAADNPQYVYIYAVALAEVGRVEEAIAALELAQLDFPNNAQIREALQAYRAL